SMLRRASTPSLRCRGLRRPRRPADTRERRFPAAQPRRADSCDCVAGTGAGETAGRNGAVASWLQLPGRCEVPHADGVEEVVEPGVVLVLLRLISVVFDRVLGVHAAPLIAQF